MERENDILQDSYYLINFFHKKDRKITQLHVQKLMFLLEAYYMNAMDKEQLYECGYKAWNFGPVASRLYKKYKNYGSDDIQITEEEKEFGNKIPEEKKKLIEKLYDTFGSFSAIQLVSFTHSEKSPWKNVWEKNLYGDISKTEIKEWFSKYVRK